MSELLLAIFFYFSWQNTKKHFLFWPPNSFNNRLKKQTNPLRALANHELFPIARMRHQIFEEKQNGHKGLHEWAGGKGLHIWTWSSSFKVFPSLIFLLLASVSAWLRCAHACTCVYTGMCCCRYMCIGNYALHRLLCTVLTVPDVSCSSLPTPWTTSTNSLLLYCCQHTVQCQREVFQFHR